MKMEEKFFWGALVGSAIGATAALLFTPLAGRNLRKRILSGLYQPLNFPKGKFFSTKRHPRPVSKSKSPKVSSRLDGKGKAPKKRAHKTTAKEAKED